MSITSSIVFGCAFAAVALALPRTAAAAKEDSDAGKVAEQLQAFLDGKLPPEKLEVTYSDLHGLYGGLKMTVRGDGKVEQQAVRREVPEPRQASAAAVRELVGLLIQQQAWKQSVPEAVLVPDESRATLKIVAGDATSTIWERVGQMKSNDRLIRISTRMQKLAWTK